MREMPVRVLKAKVKALQDFLGPRLDYSTDSWPWNPVDRWLLEYYFVLRELYYEHLRKRKRRL